jgi:Peptidase MA superfamily
MGNRKIGPTLAIVVATLVVTSCSVVQRIQGYPKEYVLDRKVVFLMQKTEFGPIRYDPAPADPYAFPPYDGPIDRANPSFLGNLQFASIQAADFCMDSRLHQEAAAHFPYIQQLPVLAELRTILEADTDPSIERGDNYRSIETARGTLAHLTSHPPQYQLEIPGGRRYTLFLGDDGAVRSLAVWNRAGVRFDWDPDSRRLSARVGDRAVEIDAEYDKRLMTVVEDETARSWRTDRVISYFRPDGVRLSRLDGAQLAFADIAPAWPEGYVRQTVGPFDVLYIPKDEALIARLDAARLTDLEARCRSLAGLAAVGRRVILIPPDLASYRKLHARRPGDLTSWYPSGFEALDYITMWPPSVPRYRQPAGEDYFWNEEFYEIVAHEYVHLMVDETTGIFSPVPAWLNEGLAVYVECRLWPDARKYWDTVYEVSRARGRLLPWNEVTKNGTGAYAIALARVHYAQSYAMVSSLVGAYGIAKVAEYVRSFRVALGDADGVNLSRAFTANFQAVFGVPWEEGVALLEKTSAP